MRLIIEDLEGSTTVVNLGTEAVTIGRKPHNTIQLTEQNVSRNHAKLVFQDDGWLIEDLGSYNGVKVNGVAIAGSTLLRESDLIQIGDYHLTLTDDVDRATVDIGPRMAANDGMVTGAVTGMASGELPSVSVEDLPPMRAPSFAPGDSAAFRAEPAQRQDENKNKAGLILGIVGAIVALAGLAIWAATSGDEGEADKPEVAGDSGGKSEQPTPPQPTPTPPQPSDSAGADDGLVVEDSADGGGEVVATDGGGEVVATDGGGEVVETDGGDEIIEEPEPEPKPKSTTKPKQRDKPSTPKLSPEEALKQARKASLTGNNKQAYSLAKDAYDQNKSSEALSVMGVAACKMGSASKAKSAYRKMTSSKDKQMLEKLCTPLGIELK